MAETVGELLVKIGADVGDLKEQLASVGLSLDKLTKSGRAAESSFSKLGASTVVLNNALELAHKALEPLAQGLQEIIAFLDESVAAAGREEAAQARLIATLRASGQFSEQFAEQLGASANALESLTGITSEAITEAQALFISFGIGTDQIEPLVRAAITLSKTFGGDLRDNARKLAVDISGESDALGRLGIKHDEAAGKAQRFADVLAFTSKLADPTRIEGYNQQIAALGASYDSLEKSIGNVIISTPEFQALLRATTETLTQLATTVRENRTTLIDFVGGGIDLAIEALGLLETAAADALKVLELLNAFNPIRLAETVDKLASGTSLTPMADSIASLATRTAEFQGRVNDLAAEIRVASASAKGKDGLGGITDEAAKAAATAKEIGPSFADMGAQITRAGTATSTALAKVNTNAGEMKASFEAALDAGAAFGNTGGRLGPVFDEAGRRITAAGDAAKGAFSAISDLGTSAGTKVAVLGDVFDRTRAQAQKAADAIQSINQLISGIRVDASTVGLPALDAALAATAEQVRKIGENARLSSGEMQTALSAAADAVRVKFAAIGQADVAGAFRALDLEIQKVSFRGIDDQLAEFLIHLEQLKRDGKLSVQQVGQAADEAQRKFAALAGGKALGDVSKEIARAKTASDLFGRSFDDVGQAINLARQKMIDLRIAGEGATPEFAALATQLAALTGEQVIKFEADISGAESALSTLKADVAAGVPDYKIRIDQAEWERQLSLAKQKALSFLEGTRARIEADLDVAKLEADYEKWKAFVESNPPNVGGGGGGGQELTGPVRFNPSLGNVTITGEFPAGGREIIAALGKLQAELAAAIKSGNTAQIAALKAQAEAFSADFKASFQLLASLPQVTLQGAGVQQAQKQLDALKSLETILRQLDLTTSRLSSIGDFTGQFVGLSALSPGFAAIDSRQSETNVLLRESNDIARATLNATNEVRLGLRSTNFAIDTLKQQQAAQRVAGGSSL